MTGFMTFGGSGNQNHSKTSNQVTVAPADNEKAEAFNKFFSRVLDTSPWSDQPLLAMIGPLEKLYCPHALALEAELKIQTPVSGNNTGSSENIPSPTKPKPKTGL